MTRRGASGRAGSGGALPESLRPMLAVAGSLPEGDEWRYELKWDGVRALAFVEDGCTRLVSRSGRDLSAAYPELATGDPLGGGRAVLDGEVVAFDHDGRPSFQALQSRQATRRAGGEAAPIAYLIFDLLQLGSRSLLDLPYDERRAELARRRLTHPAWSAPESFGPPGREVLEASRKRGLEGVVAKRRDSRYLPGRRSDAWVKVKNFRTQEVVVGGWTEGEGRRRSSFGSLLVGVRASRGTEELEYVGRVGTGFDEARLADLLVRLRPLERDRSPFAGPLGAVRAVRSHFVEPWLVGEVRFSGWTDDGLLRQSVWRGLRDDKAPGEVRREP